MATIQTVRIKHGDDFAVINATDFDADAHEAFDDEAAEIIAALPTPSESSADEVGDHREHRGRAAGGSADEDEAEEVSFASPAAAALFAGSDIRADQLGEPSSANGYTKADVQAALDAQNASE